MLIGDFVSGEMNIDDRAALYKEFPEQTLGDFLIKIANINGSLLVAFVKGGDLSHRIKIRNNDEVI